MDKYVSSADGLKIHYSLSGKGNTALVLVHGWLGSGKWWSAQEKYFEDRYLVATIDLVGHGQSDKNRVEWSSWFYADDVNKVANQIDAPNIILIGHSMAGAFVLEAALSSPKTKAIILVDTLKNLDQVMTAQQAEDMLFINYRKNFKDAVENLLPKFLFCPATPETVKKRLQKEFLENDPLVAVKLLEPLYKMDVRQLASKITIPVRAINASFTPTNKDNNIKYFKNYDYVSIENSGHYPMLEQPEDFNETLSKVLAALDS